MVRARNEHTFANVSLRRSRWAILASLGGPKRLGGPTVSHPRGEFTPFFGGGGPPVLHAICAGRGRADARTRTGDPFITSEVLYQLSYVGRSAAQSSPVSAPGDRGKHRVVVGRIGVLVV